MLAELGRGGMGAVFRARHVETGGEVALKVLVDVRGPEDVARFVREGQAVARLRHPGVVTVHAAGQVRGCPWLAMDLVEGESLRARLDRDGPLDAPTARRLFARLAAALEHAHAHGVLHRDLKPENVIVDLVGEPRLIDFGLAQVSDRSRLTRTGDMLGTPSYMAPEQVLGDLAATGPRTDVYGFGATLYDALTGRPPFSASTLVVLEQVLKHAPPSPVRVRPGVDPELAALCLACLEKDPARRPASAAALARALGPGRARRRRGRARRLWLALPPALALLVVAAVAALGPTPAAPEHQGLASVTSAAPPPPVATEPTPPPDPLVRVEALVAGGDRASALAALDAALREAPARADLRARRGVLRFEAGDGQGALDDLEAALEQAPSVAGYVARARLRGSMGAHAQAEADALAAVSLDPRSPDARTLRAALLDRTGDAARAQAEVEEALRLAPDHVDALRLASKLRFGAGDAAGALAHLEAALARRPDDPDLLANRAAARSVLRDDAGAVDDLLRVDQLAGGLVLGEYVMLANALMRLRRWPEADAAYARARSLAPPDDVELVEELRFEAGQVGARVLGDEALEAHARGERAAAIELLTRAIALDPGFANAPYNRGQMHLEAGDARAALADFDLTLTLEDDDETRLSRAATLLLLGEGARARADLDVALARGGPSLELFEQRCVASCLAGDLAGALADADRACASAPRELRPLILRAELRLSKGDAAGAEGDADAALRLGPGSVEALTFRGRARAALGRAAEALADLDEACRRGPTSPFPFLFRALHRRASDPTAGLDDLRHAASLQVGGTQDLAFRAEARALAGDVRGALADCDLVIASDARMVEALLLRARLRRQAGDLAGARADLELGAARTPAETDIGRALRAERAALGR